MAPENARIVELRRRIEADPESIAFAQLAEEYRREGQYAEAVKYCRLGLLRHPEYLSARVTLGRALLELGALDEAAPEFELVLRSLPDNLGALRGLAEIHERRGAVTTALEYYKRALALARFDPKLEATIDRMDRVAGRTPEDNHADIPPSAPASADHAVSAPASVPVGGPSDKPFFGFDELLTALGVPDAPPPPATERLFSDAPVTTRAGEPLVPDMPAQATGDDVFGRLEEELRTFARAQAAPDQSALLEELEGWLRAVATVRKASGRS